MRRDPIQETLEGASTLVQWLYAAATVAIFFGICTLLVSQCEAGKDTRPPCPHEEVRHAAD